jgi:hypothetical protein
MFRANPKTTLMGMVGGITGYRIHWKSAGYSFAGSGSERMEKWLVSFLAVVESAEGFSVNVDEDAIRLHVEVDLPPYG